jgi:Uma2 family endonuclease
MNPAMTPLFTRKDYLELPEGFPAQLIQGLLVKDPEPTYGHGALGTRLLFMLGRVVGADRLPLAPVRVEIDEHNCYHPDIQVLAAPIPFESKDVGVPLLVFEILSPSDARRSRTVKKDNYLAAGVGEVWIVDSHDESVEVHDRSGVRRARGEQEVRSRVLPEFAVVPRTLFAPPV